LLTAGNFLKHPDLLFVLSHLLNLVALSFPARKYFVYLKKLAEGVPIREKHHKSEDTQYPITG